MGRKGGQGNSRSDSEALGSDHGTGGQDPRSSPEQCSCCQIRAPFTDGPDHFDVSGEGLGSTDSGVSPGTPIQWAGHRRYVERRR